MGHPKLASQLMAAGYRDAHAHAVDGADFVVFTYRVQVGARATEEVRVGLQAPDWPINPPGGPHVSPRVRHPGDDAHHASPLGEDWIYWSRPHPDWAQTDRSLGAYLLHLRTLFAQIQAAA